MIIDDDFYGELVKTIKEQTIYLRHYYGEVVNNIDELKKGRVKVTIPELGFTSKDLSLWCNPRQGHSMSVPKVGTWVEVYFINGDPEFPVYLHMASRISGNTPSSYTGDTRKHVLFQDPDQAAGNVIYDSNGDILTFLEGAESFVLGDTAKTELQKNVDALTQLQADFTAWTPVPNDGGGALKTILAAPTGFLSEAIASLTNILSSNIKGK